jgi:D-threo-aldose 1-dehydrogenase
MLTRRLGRTEVSVTALGFGAAPIGNLYSPLTDEDAYAAIETAWNGGVRYFDTAPHYGLGLSEERLGAALAGRPRAQFAVSTKVGRLLQRNPVPTGSDLPAGGFAVPDTLIRAPDYTRDGVLRSLEASLKRLRLDRVDVVYVHDPDDHMDQAIHEALPALADLRDQGVVGAIGAGMNTVAPLTRIVAEANVDVLMVAGRWTLLDRTAEPLLDACVARDVSVVAAAPFNSGLLAHRWPPDDAYFDYGPAPTPVLEHARDLARACAPHGTTLPHAAIQFPLRHPAVASVVTGVRTRAQAQSALDWSAADIPEHLWTEVELGLDPL